MADIVKGRIYLPPEDASNPTDRDVMHPETNIESVLVNTGKNNDVTVKLSEVLDYVVHVTENGAADSTYKAKQNCVVIERTTVVL